MDKFAFNSEGVQLLLSRLYALPTDELNEVVDALEADFPGWMNQYFLLSERQQAYLAEMDPAFVKQLIPFLTDHLEDRLPIYLMKAGDDEEEDDLRGKLMSFQANEQLVYSAGSGMHNARMLTIQISYLSKKQ